MPNASASIKIRPPQFKVEASVLPSAALELIKQHNNSDDGRPSVSSVVESALEKASEVLNFQISMTIYFIVSALFSIILIGIPFLIGLGIFYFIITIVAAISANDGKCYRYPINLRLIK